MPKWRRFGIITTSLLRNMSTGKWHAACSIADPISRIPSNCPVRCVVIRPRGKDYDGENGRFVNKHVRFWEQSLLESPMLAHVSRALGPHGLPMKPEGRLNIKMSSYKYRNPHVKIRRSLTWESRPGKDGLDFERGPRRQWWSYM